MDGLVFYDAVNSTIIPANTGIEVFENSPHLAAGADSVAD